MDIRDVEFGNIESTVKHIYANKTSAEIPNENEPRRPIFPNFEEHKEPGKQPPHHPIAGNPTIAETNQTEKCSRKRSACLTEEH
jgi:hypothetical protein